MQLDGILVNMLKNRAVKHPVSGHDFGIKSHGSVVRPRPVSRAVWHSCT